MRRRAILAATAGVLAGARPVRADATRVLRFLPRGDPGGLDPVADPRPEVADAALLIWDTLYGVDSRLQPQPQMCAGHEASDDRRIWTFRLRPGLRFHDGAPVRAADAVASLRRWMARDIMGGAILARLDALEVLDTLRFRFRLTAPFGPLLYALGKSDPPLAVVLPERLALTPATQPVAEPIGSGPLRAQRSDWQPGSRLVFDRFDGYQPRDEAPDWLAGGKRVLFDRIEWTILPDPAQAAEAMQNGAADWWTGPTADLAPLLKRSRDLVVDLADPLGRVGLLRLNRMAAPFDRAQVRGAVMQALDQTACMAALTSGDDALWRGMAGVFTPGTPAATACDGGARGPGDVDAARRAVADAGAAGAAAVVLAPGDDPGGRALGRVIAAALQRIGVAAELQMQGATSGPARGAGDPWQAAIVSTDGAAAATPAGVAVRDDDAPSVAEARAAWYSASAPAAADAACVAVNRAVLADATAIPIGQFLRYQAWRTSLSGVVKAPYPVVWAVRKT